MHFLKPLIACAPFLPLVASAPYFVLAGDSTTAVQSDGGGGWGDGFLSILTNGAAGVNLGHNGRTTASYVSGGDWATVLSDVSSKKGSYDVYVTIQFGHNDQKSTSGVTTAQYQTNLENMATDVVDAGGTPILVTPLSRRKYSNGVINQDLETQRELTIAAANAVGSAYIDLNIASVNYLNAIGETDATTYDLHGDDQTHLNTQGSVVFGTMVAYLIETGPFPDLASYFNLDATAVSDIENGIYWYPSSCSGDYCGSD